MATAKVALVTGGTSGIGFHVALALCGKGFRVFVTGRDESRAAPALHAIRAVGGQAEFIAVDHSSLGANRSLAATLAAHTAQLDVLVNNIGALLPTRQETADGVEATLAVNFAGPVALTLGVVPLLKAASHPRVVNMVSSSLFMWKRPPLEDVESRDRYVGIDAHAHAKLLNLIWIVAFARKNSDIVANAVNPGMAWTAMTQSLTPQAVPAWRYIWPIVRFFQRRASASDAAAGPVKLAMSEEAAAWTGRYFDGKLRPLPAVALDEKIQDRVWDLGTALAER